MPRGEGDYTTSVREVLCFDKPASWNSRFSLPRDCGDDLGLLHWKSLLRLAKDFEYLGCALDQSCKAPVLCYKCSRQWKKKKRKKVYLRSGLIIELGWWGESALYGRHALVLTGCIKVWWAIIWLRCCVQNISVIVNNGWAFHVTTSTNLQLQYRHLQQTAITWSRK